MNIKRSQLVTKGYLPNLGFQFIGIEREAEYIEIAKKRIGE